MTKNFLVQKPGTIVLGKSSSNNMSFAKTTNASEGKSLQRAKHQFQEKEI